MSRLSKEDWLQAGLELLSDYDQSHINIQNLCEYLDITRGSFYHHFDSMPSYTKELLQYWRDSNKELLLDAAQGLKGGVSARQVMQSLVPIAHRKAELSIRSWAYYQNEVRVMIQKIDALRLDYLSEAYQRQGLSLEHANRLSKIQYAVLLGLQQVHPEMETQELQDIYQFFSGLIGHVETL
ncbi:MAG: TetR/AcrR family transcriptional regulator [Rickettsiales bacterium]|nr:TetR/AcrR family transcriptional regulator [Rickettsiales bacterium]NRB62316.1 TetR/AcrR family transcriptional regulator [Saprospiraceae bacterium]